MSSFQGFLVRIPTEVFMVILSLSLSSSKSGRVS